ncbi:hypothetical protein EDB80DRAFT_731047 [Ilyonectria destructans]|nr:hypothetical protein EDB80DRAFT_731047 [Ilyonectria destructans]
MARRNLTRLPWAIFAMFAVSINAESTMPYRPLPKNTTREATSFILDPGQHMEHVQVLCHYAISGNYCLLPRALFYATIIAALVLRHHPWLYIGALAASLTYSGSAAIHAIILWCSNRAWGELDVIALAAILSVSCTVLVPLLNWSSTIRNAGNPAKQARRQKEKFDRLGERLAEWDRHQMHRINEKRMGEPNNKIVTKADLDEAHHRRTFERRLKRLEVCRDKKRLDHLDAASRTILIVWGVLVTIGFAFMFVAIVDPSPDARYGRYEYATYTYATEIVCLPDNGTFDLQAGQDPNWPYFFFSSEFLDANGCQDPCPISPAFQGAAMFRESRDLTAFSKKEVNLFATSISTWDFLRRAVNILWVLPYVLLQGIWATFLGRSQPGEARLRVYGFLLRLPLDGRPKGQGAGPLQCKVAKLVAFMTYAWAVFATVLAVPLLVANLVVAEIYLYELPQSESPMHIGAWSPYTSTALALISLFIGAPAVKKYAKDLLERITTSLRRIGRFIVTRKRTPRTKLNQHRSVRALRFIKRVLYVTPIDVILERRNHILDALHEEWKDTAAYLRNPDEELAKFVGHREEDIAAEHEMEKEQLQISPEPRRLGLVTYHAITM